MGQELQIGSTGTKERAGAGRFLASFYGQTEAAALTAVPFPGATPPLAGRGIGGLAGDLRGEVAVHGLDDRISRMAAPGIRREQLQVLAVGDVAEFDQNRGHVRRLEDAKTSRFERVLVKPGTGLELA